MDAYNHHGARIKACVTFEHKGYTLSLSNLMTYPAGGEMLIFDGEGRDVTRVLTSRDHLGTSADDVRMVTDIINQKEAL